jgi:uncharacterized protein YecT (DUF1311 family)
MYLMQYSAWIIPVPLLIAIAWVRFNQPPTNRSGTTCQVDRLVRVHHRDKARGACRLLLRENGLKRRARSQEEALAAVFSARMSYLEASPELAATLQKSQTAWVEFRDANCAYIQSIARPAYSDEAFQNCLLRTTIYRRVHLRWSVGD